MLRNIITILFYCFFPLCAFSEQTDFWEYWGDGKAELDFYSLEIPRYGQQRKGEAVLIYVTEDFLTDEQVKADFDVPVGKKVPVLKLNHVKKFQTGVYDYNIMTSVFSPLENWKIGFSTIQKTLPIKISLSAFEWCGNYYAQINRNKNHYALVGHSYFASEADFKNKIAIDSGIILEDNLFIRMRELTENFQPGKYRMLGSLLFSRLLHQPQDYLDVVIKVKETDKLKTYYIESEQRDYTVDIEKQWPRKITAWKIEHKVGSLQGGVETAKLLKSTRNPYWIKNLNGDKLF